MRMHTRAALCALLSLAGALAVGACTTVTDGPAASADGGEGDAASPLADAPAAQVDAEPPPDVDAGPRPDADAGPKAECSKNEDCVSRVCNKATGKCSPSTCADRTLNQDETDTDCGGSFCPACKTFGRCLVAADCESQVCVGDICQAPACTDGRVNGSETDVDCGGPECPKCADTRACKGPADCQSDVCQGSVCASPRCDDGTKNGTDTDIDCGGGECPRCTDGKQCRVADDCLSGSCADLGAGLQCQPPSCSDGLLNGSETDVDCGGATCPKCSRGKGCLDNGDCASGGCNYLRVCAAGRSCVSRWGGDTCGLGGEGGVGPEQWEDCCTTAPVTLPGGGTANVDKYPVTSGRMRVFLSSIGYNVRSFVRSARSSGAIPAIPGTSTPVLPSQWDDYLPTSFGGDSNPGERFGCAERDCLPLGSTSCTCQPGTSFRGIYTAASRHIGGFIFQGNAQSRTGCFVGGPGSHAFRFPNGAQDGPPPDYPQEVYDRKTMNCVTYLVAQAFCVWDGGRLETVEEWQSAFGPGPLPWSAATPVAPVLPEERGLAPLRGDQTYWGCRFPWATDTLHAGCSLTWDTSTKTIERAAYLYSYEYPKLVGTDYIAFIPAPGRTTGRGPFGHSDLVGAVQEITSDVTYHVSPHEARHRWTGNGSWDMELFDRSSPESTGLLNKTSRLGLRCAR